MDKPAWESPLRLRNLDYNTKKEIPPEEFARGGWYNVTSYSTPGDAHEWVYTGFGRRTEPVCTCWLGEERTREIHAEMHTCAVHGDQTLRHGWKNEPMTNPMTVFHPVQNERPLRTIPESVVLRAYDVYCHLYGAQPAMVDVAKGCRGGFSTGELIAFLYARAFPKSEWRQRVDEALERKADA